MTAPQALLLDEPTSALDLETADRMIDTLRRLNGEKGLTIVIATHRLQEAERASDYAVMLDHGRSWRRTPPRTSSSTRNAPARAEGMLEDGRSFRFHKSEMNNEEHMLSITFR